MGCIYQIINVGSAIDFRKRKSQHLSHLRKNKHHSFKLQNSFNKYGEECFLFTVLQNDIIKEDLLSVEQKYLDLINPELNTCKYAVSGFGRIKDKVCCFDLNGVFLKEFNSTFDACEFYNLKEGKVRLVCNFVFNKHRGMSFRWSNYLKENGFEKIKQEILNMKSKLKREPINQLSLNGEFIKKWGSISDIVKSLGFSYEVIRLCCKGDCYTCSGYKWEYSDEILKKEGVCKVVDRINFKKENKVNHKRFNHKGSIPILATSLVDGSVSEYPSMKEAQRQIGVHQSNIFKVLNGLIKKCNNYTFDYAISKNCN